MKTGITQFVLSKHSTLDFLDAAAQAGYEAVELRFTSPEGDLSPNADPSARAAIAAAAAERQLEITSVAHSHLTGNLLADGPEQERSIEETRCGLVAARELGATCTLHTLGGLRPDLYYEAAFENAVAALQALAPTCEQTGVDIAIEFVWNGFLFSPLEMRRLLEEVGSPHIGFYFDPGNMAVFQRPEHWVRALKAHIKRVHLKDWRGRALNGGWTALLEGEVDFPTVMRELQAAGYTGPLISEVDPSLASLEATAEAIRKIAAMA